MALLVAASALFAIGVALERARSHHDAAAEQPAAPSETGETGTESSHAEAGEASAENPLGESREDGESKSETVLGVEVESPGAVAAVVTVSVLLAVAVWRRPFTGVYALVALFATGATVFDIAEIRHQASDGTISLAVIAAAVTALHAAIVLVAAKTASATRSTSPHTA